MTKVAAISERDIDEARAAAACVVTTHRRLAEWMKVGMTLFQIDDFVAKTLEDQGASSCFLGYIVGRSAKFPSHACLSVNACVVHGTAASHTAPMKPGDVLKVDIGVWLKGFVGDAAWTYVFKEGSPETMRLMESGKTSLARGVKQLRPGNTYLAWAKEVQTCVEREYGYHLIRGLGGHGYGRKNGKDRGLHKAPFVSNVVPTYPGEWPDALAKCTPGTLVAVEPMIAVGTGETKQKSGEWPVFSADGSLTVHYEHDVLITPEGPEVLTAGLESLPDVVG